MTYMTYEQWLKEQSDKTIMALWIKHCAPNENETNLTRLQIERGSMIHREAQDRDLLPGQMSDQY